LAGYKLKLLLLLEAAAVVLLTHLVLVQVVVAQVGCLHLL
jgi:hypothetical protein